MKIKHLKTLFLVTILFVSKNLFAQLGVNSDNSAPHTSAQLDVKSSTKGVLIPRVAADLGSPTEGLLYYNTTGHNFRYYDGTAWQNALFGNQWNVNGLDISYSLGNVGIGTNTPMSALNIYKPTNSLLFLQNTATGTTIDDGLYLGYVSSTNAYLFNREAGSLAFGTSDATRMTISSVGNVGIGTVSPTSKLHVNGTGRFNSYLEVDGSIYGYSSASFSSTVSVGSTLNVTGTVNANGNLAVDGNITTNTGKGIVRSNDANQLAIDEIATPSNLSWNLNAGGTICCVGIGFSTFTATPSIAFGETTGATNPGFISYTIDSITNNSAQIRVTNIGNGNSTAAGNGQFKAMIIGRR